MLFRETPLKGSYIIERTAFTDDRGAFSRLFCAEELLEIGHTKPIVQINHSITKKKGAVRGLHFQYAPHAEIKIVQCIKGKVWDIMVDLRRQSPTFLHHFSQEISPSNGLTMYIPEGFAHGFQTLEDDCQLLYFHTSPYVKTSEGRLRYDDPRINIQWPLEPTDLSARDAAHDHLNMTFDGIETR